MAVGRVAKRVPRVLVRILREERYDVVLVICTATVVLSVTGVDPVTAASGIVGLGLVVATLIESSPRSDRRSLLWALIAIAAAAVVVELLVVDASEAVVGPAIVTLLGFGAAVTVTRQVLSRPFPNVTSIAASACAYLLIGYSFSSLYIVIDRTIDGHFLASGDALTPESAIYFSFVTLTTLGFGDLAPAPSSGRIIVTFEAMLGQFYIAIAVARLVAGMAVGAADSESRDSSAGNGPTGGSSPPEEP